MTTKKRRRIGRKLFSVLLIMIMLLSTMSTSVFAGEVTGVAEAGDIAVQSENAFDAVSPEDTQSGEESVATNGVAAVPTTDAAGSGEGAAPVQEDAQTKEFASIAEFEAAFEAMGDATDYDAAMAVIAKIESVYNRLSDADKASVAEQWVYIQGYAETLHAGNPDAGIEAIAYDYNINGKYTVNVRAYSLGRSLGTLFVPCGGYFSVSFAWNESGKRWEPRISASSGVTGSLSSISDYNMAGVTLSYNAPSTGNGSTTKGFSGGTAVSNSSQYKVTIQYVDQDTGKVVVTDSYQPAKYGTSSVAPNASKLPSGYTLVSTSPVSVTTGKDGSSPNPVVFFIKRDHTWVWKDNGDGTHKQECTDENCNETQNKGKHDKSNKVSETAATCTAGGVITWHCNTCNHNWTETTPALGHIRGTWVDNNDSNKHDDNCKSSTHKEICIRSGCGAVLDTASHTYSDWTIVKEAKPGVEGLRTRTCTQEGCGHVEKQVIEALPTHTHSWDNGTVTKNPTCAQKGEITFKCDGCDEVKTEEIPIDPNAHDWGEWREVNAATIDNAGVEERVCNHNDQHKQEREIPILPFYTVTWSDGYTDTPLGDEKKYDENLDVNDIPESDYPQQPTREGYTFTGWEITGPADGKVTITATWSQDPVIPTPSPTPGPTPGPTAPVVTPGTPATPVATPVATPTAATTAPAALVSVADEAVPLANVDGDETRQVADESVPLAKGAESEWALLNLLLMIFTVLVSGMLLILYFSRRKESPAKEGNEQLQVAGQDEETERLRKRGLFRLLSIIPAVVAVIFFILTEDMRNPMVFTDKWTLWMAVFALVNVVLVIFAKKKKYDNDDTQKPDYGIA